MIPMIHHELRRIWKKKLPYFLIIVSFLMTSNILMNLKAAESDAVSKAFSPFASEEMRKLGEELVMRKSELTDSKMKEKNQISIRITDLQQEINRKYLSDEVQNRKILYYQNIYRDYTLPGADRNHRSYGIYRDILDTYTYNRERAVNPEFTSLNMSSAVFSFLRFFGGLPLMFMTIAIALSREEIPGGPLKRGLSREKESISSMIAATLSLVVILLIPGLFLTIYSYATSGAGPIDMRVVLNLRNTSPLTVGTSTENFLRLRGGGRITLFQSFFLIGIYNLLLVVCLTAFTQFLKRFLRTRYMTFTVAAGTVYLYTLFHSLDIFRNRFSRFFFLSYSDGLRDTLGINPVAVINGVRGDLVENYFLGLIVLMLYTAVFIAAAGPAERFLVRLKDRARQRILKTEEGETR